MFRTGSLTARSHRQNISGLKDYAALNERMSVAHNMQGTQRGDPEKLVRCVVDLVRGEGYANGKEMPDALPIGKDAVQAARTKCERTLKTLREWEDMSCHTDF